MSVDVPSVYFVLGAAGSARREVLCDMIASGLAPGESAAVLVSNDDLAAGPDEKLRRAGATVHPWRWQRPRIAATIPTGTSQVFLLADGRSNPVDQIEALTGWLRRTGAKLARILCIVNARLGQTRPEVLPWFDACVHFADVVLVTKHEGIDPKWLAEFEKRFKDQHFPFLFEVVEHGTVKNPALVLEAQARRISQAFDEEMELTDETEAEVEAAKPENDRYLAKMRGGARVVAIPDIRDYLDKES